MITLKRQTHYQLRQSDSVNILNCYDCTTNFTERILLLCDILTLLVFVH